MIEQLVGQGCAVAYDRPQGACKALETLNPCLWQDLWRLCKTDTWGGGVACDEETAQSPVSQCCTYHPPRLQGEHDTGTLHLWIQLEDWCPPGRYGLWKVGQDPAKTAEIKTVLSLISPHRGLTTPMSAGCTTLTLLLSSGTHASVISHFLSSCLTFHDLHH